jgi:hypothetical protein
MATRIDAIAETCQKRREKSDRGWHARGYHDADEWVCSSLLVECRITIFDAIDIDRTELRLKLLYA